MLFAQLLHLIRRYWQHRKQPVLLGNRYEIYMARHPRIAQRGAHLPHTVPHLCQLVEPDSSHIGIAQDQTNCRTAMVRRHRPGRARQRIGVGKYSLQRIRIARHRIERAHAIAIHAEVLVTAIGDESLWHSVQNLAQAVSILFHTMAQPLIGQINDRESAASRKCLGNSVPFLVRIVDASRVMARAVEQHSVIRACVVDRIENRLEVGAAICAGMLEPLRLKRDVVEDLRVVGPAGLADVQPIHASLLRERDRKPDSACAARRLHTGDTAAHRRIATEDVGHQTIDEAHVAFWSKVRLAVLRFDQFALGLFDCSENGRVALPRAVNTNAKVDLVMPLISSVHFYQGEQRIGRLRGKVLKHGMRHATSYERPQQRNPYCGPHAYIFAICSFELRLRMAASAAS